jgi:hypothetical protein
MISIIRTTATVMISAAAFWTTTTLAHAQSGDGVVGTVVQFSNDAVSVEMIIGEDNPTVRDFLSLLPATMTLEEFNGREKIGYFARQLTVDGSPGSDPEDGDLIYYAPWGNLGFYYNTSGVGFSDQTIHIGTYDATLEQLEALLSAPVTIEVIR